MYSLRGISTDMESKGVNTYLLNQSCEATAVYLL